MATDSMTVFDTAVGNSPPFLTNLPFHDFAQPSATRPLFFRQSPFWTNRQKCQPQSELPTAAWGHTIVIHCETVTWYDISHGLVRRLLLMVDIGRPSHTDERPDVLCNVARLAHRPVGDCAMHARYMGRGGDRTWPPWDVRRRQGVRSGERYESHRRATYLDASNAAVRWRYAFQTAWTMASSVRKRTRTPLTEKVCISTPGSRSSASISSVCTVHFCSSGARERVCAASRHYCDKDDGLQR